MRNTKNWSQEYRDSVAYSSGYMSHSPYTGYLEQEMVDMVKKGYFALLPYHQVRQFEDLRLSHPAVIPQQSRRPRTIIDYTESGVNQATVPLAHPEAMQFGRARDRLFHTILTADPRHGPVYMCKHDVSDGFYRIFVDPWAALALSVVMPRRQGEEPLIAVPLALPMGWKESPPTFTQATETVVDLANRFCTPSWNPPVHHLEAQAMIPAPPPPDD